MKRSFHTISTRASFLLFLIAVGFPSIHSKRPMFAPNLMTRRRSVITFSQLFPLLRIRGGDSSSFPNPNGNGIDDDDFPSLPQEPPEATQDRINRWKEEQLRYGYEQQVRTQQGAPAITDNRMKLIGSVTKGARSSIFMILAFRMMHLQGVAADRFKSNAFRRLLTVVPILWLSVANVVGGVISTRSQEISSGSKVKKRLKAILNVNKLVEALLIVFYLCRLTIAPSKHHPREIFISNVIHSGLFISLAQGYTAVLWWDNLEVDEESIQSSSDVEYQDYGDGYGYQQQQQLQQNYAGQYYEGTSNYPQ